MLGVHVKAIALPTTLVFLLLRHHEDMRTLYDTVNRCVTSCMKFIHLSEEGESLS